GRRRNIAGKLWKLSVRFCSTAQCQQRDQNGERATRQFLVHVLFSVVWIMNRFTLPRAAFWLVSVAAIISPRRQPARARIAFSSLRPRNRQSSRCNRARRRPRILESGFWRLDPRRGDLSDNGCFGGSPDRSLQS